MPLSCPLTDLPPGPSNSPVGCFGGRIRQRFAEPCLGHMADFMGSASAVLAAAQHRVEVSAQNISNMSTPGYRRKLSFERAVASAASGMVEPPFPADADRLHHWKGDRDRRPAQFRDRRRRVFHSCKGKNRPSTPEMVSSVGTRTGGWFRVLDCPFNYKVAATSWSARATSKLCLMAPCFRRTSRSADSPWRPSRNNRQVSTAQDGLFTTDADNVTAAGQATVRQGALESSNVSTGDEMVSVMQALRSAEVGQRLVNVYDDLMGRAITTFGQQS